jgi:uncharacterized protein YndB with AHSA1/START domain
MSKSISHTYFYAHPPAVVWAYLTKAELISLWLMKTDFQPIVGFPFRFTTNPLPQFEFDGIAYCTVLEVVPNKRLSYSWKAGPGEGEITLDSIVVWTLTEKDQGTELHLEHTGFKEIENFKLYAPMDKGWLGNMQKIDTLINAGKHATT